MARLSLFTLTERLIEAIQTSFTPQPAKSPDYDALLAAELAAWHARRPHFRQIESQNAGPPMYSDEGSSESGDTDGSETLVSEDNSHTTLYAMPGPRKQASAIMLSGKILPNIASFDEDNTDTSDNESFYSFHSNRAEPDLKRTTATSDGHDGHLNHCDTSFRGPLIECVTALAPAPLHHSGKTRSKVVFIPADAPDVCSVHDSASCEVCQPIDKPVIFII